MEIILADYFQGKLLKYSMTIEAMNASVPTDIKHMIKLNDPFRTLGWQFISEDSYLKQKVIPFPRSSVIRDEYGSTML